MGIIKTPEGEAPLWVRNCLIGIELNYVRFSNSEQPQRKTLNVRQDHALKALALQHPDAAVWWVNAGYPIDTFLFFSFDEDECEVRTEEVLSPEACIEL